MERRRAIAVLTGVLVAGLTGCARSVPRYCDDSSDCSGEAWFCDVDGERAGVGNTCIAVPDAAVVPPPDGQWTGRVHQLVAGYDFACARFRDGSVRCWGDGSLGTLGYGNEEDIGDDEDPLASPVALGEPAVQLGTGNSHACAVLASGATRCWGINNEGQLGIAGDAVGDDESPESVDPIELGGTPLLVAGGVHHSCALFDGGAVRCWGNGSAGALGYGTTADVAVPAAAGDVPVGGEVAQLDVGGRTTCAVHDNGTVRCWGDNLNGRLGYGHDDPLGDDEPASAAGTLTVDGWVAEVDVGVGGAFQCLRTMEGKVRCWGSSTVLGHDQNAVPSVPPGETPDLALGAPAKQVVVGRYHACALLDDGRVRCWGNNAYGRLGLGDDDERDGTSIPDGEVALGSPAVQLAAGLDFTCALVADGDQIRCWGHNNQGQLGLGHTEDIGDDELPSAGEPIALPEIP